MGNLILTERLTETGDEDTRLWLYPEGFFRTVRTVMAIFEDGDPDPIPVTACTSRQIRYPHVTREGWWGRWEARSEFDTISYDRGSWIGPFDSESDAITGAQEDWMGYAGEPESMR